MVVIITGPTASGKTALSEQLVPELNGAIINADLGQFYTSLTIGTAKPDWQHLPFDSYLFDWISEPRDVSVVAFKKQVDSLVATIQADQKTPIIVGGSSFYIKSLFYPPEENATNVVSQNIDLTAFHMLSTQELWERLHIIDAERATSIQPTDRYRLIRALTLWFSTGKKPSLLKPQFVMPYLTVVLVIVLPSRELLAERINLRAHQMIYQDDWIEEVRSLLGTSWESFVRAKKLVGYPELADWVLQGSHQNDLPAVIKTVCIKTRQYAKRQEVFLKKFAKDLATDAQNAGVNLTVLFTQDGSVQSVNKILATIKSLK